MGSFNCHCPLTRQCSINLWSAENRTRGHWVLCQNAVNCAMRPPPPILIELKKSLNFTSLIEMKIKKIIAQRIKTLQIWDQYKTKREMEQTRSTAQRHRPNFRLAVDKLSARGLMCLITKKACRTLELKDSSFIRKNIEAWTHTSFTLKP